MVMAFLILMVGAFASSLMGSSVIAIWLPIVAGAGLLGFALLALSTILPAGRKEKPTFTQELMGGERLNYGVYTEGNWMTVLDDKEKEEEKRRRR